MTLGSFFGYNPYWAYVSESHTPCDFGFNRNSYICFTMNLLKLIVIGHLGQDAALNEVNGKTVLNFSVVHKEKWKDREGIPREKPVWISCSWWTDKVQMVNVLKAGVVVYVEGRPKIREELRKDGSRAPSVLGLSVALLQVFRESASKTGSSDLTEASGEDTGDNGHGE